MAWAKNLSFETFCEYVLPYRCTETYSTYSRKYFLDRYKVLPDSIKNTDNPTIVADYIIKDIDSWFTEIPNISTKFPYLITMSFSDLMKGKVGNCIAVNSVRVTALRSLGIPATLDQIPNWGSSNSSHYWCKIIEQEQKNIPKLIDNRNIPEDTQSIISGSSYDITPLFGKYPKEVNITYKRTVPKVYRTSFRKLVTNEQTKTFKTEDIPQFFKNDRLVDVTKSYLKTADVVVKLQQSIKSRGYLYLCVFNNQNWVPIAKTIITKNQGLFTNVGRNIIYLPAYYSNGTLIPTSMPIKIDINGIQTSISPKKETTELLLYTKYPYRIFIHFLQSTLIGGKFQLANKTDLTDSINIHEVTKIPFYQTEVKVVE